MKKINFLLLVAVFVAGFISFSKGQSINLTFPTSSTPYADTIPFIYSVTDMAGIPQQVQFICTRTAGPGYNVSDNNTDTLTLKTPASSGSFKIHPPTVNDSTIYIFTSSRNTPMPDGTYNITPRYKRNGTGVVVPGVAKTGVKMDCATLMPVILYPANNARVSSTFTLVDSLPEPAALNNTYWSFSGPAPDSIRMRNSKTRDTAAIDINNIVTTTHITAATSSTLAEGTYSVTLSYKDIYNHPVAATGINLTVDTHTDAPVINSPADNSVIGTYFAFNYTLPEGNLAGTVDLKLYRNDTLIMYYTLADHASANTSSVIFGPVSPGVYTLKLKYQDDLGNPADSVLINNVTVDAVTETPSILSPATSSAISGPLFVSFTLPEIPYLNTALLIFDSAGVTNTLIVNGLTQGLNTVVLNPLHLDTAAHVYSADQSVLYDGIYNIRLQYVDTFQNPAAFVIDSNIVIDNNTLAPVLLQPAASMTTNMIPVQFTLPEMADAGSVQMIFTGAAVADTIQFADESVLSTVFIDPKQVDINYPILSATADSLPEGIYSVQLSYRDALGNAAATVMHDSITIDTHTQVPSLLSPSSGEAFSGLIKIKYTVPENYDPFSSGLTFMDADSNATLLSLYNLTVGTDSLFLDPQDFFACPNVFAYSGAASLADGIYTVAFAYADALGNPSAGSRTTGVVIDNTTLSPVLITPADSAVVNSSVKVKFTLPEAYAPGSLTMTFDSAGVVKTTLVFSDTFGTSSDSLMLNANNLLSTGVEQVSGSSPRSGIYNITLSYRDMLGNPASSAVANYVTLDMETLVPVLTQPADSKVVSAAIAMDLTIPEAALPGSVQLKFQKSGYTNTITLKDVPAGARSFVMDGNYLPGCSEVLSSTYNTLADGVYTVTLSYMDAAGNSVASVFNTNITIDMTTQAPVLILPGSNSTNSSMIDVSFTLPEEAKNSKATLTMAGADTVVIGLQTSGSGLQSYTLNGDDLAFTTGIYNTNSFTIPDGTYKLTISYRDTLSNPIASNIQTAVIVTRMTVGMPEVVSSNNSLIVYPNPSNGVFTIQSKTEGAYSIVNQMGQVVRTLWLGRSNNFSANDETLSAGIYYIVGVNNSKVVRQKLIVTK